MSNEEAANSAGEFYKRTSGLPYDSTPSWVKQGRHSDSLYDYNPEERVARVEKYFKDKAKADRQAKRQKILDMIFGKTDDSLGCGYKESKSLKEDNDDYSVACCYDPDDYFEEIYFVTEDGELSTCLTSDVKVFATSEEAIDFADENKPAGWWSFTRPVPRKSLEENKNSFFDELLNEAIEDFPSSTRSMYRFARRRHNDTGAIRKVSKQPYWVHPEGVALIVMKHGGSDIEIKAAMAHDTMEDAGVSYEDLVEKFGYKVASIVNEITNDKAEIAKVGKEKYISDELCRISKEALTVKLADMLYNQKDSPTETNYIRMRNNVNYMLDNRDDLLPIHKELAQEILDV